MMSTKLNEKIDELARQIESALGVEELEKKVKDKLEGPISNLQQPIEDVVNLTQTITSSVEKVRSWSHHYYYSATLLTLVVHQFETELNDYKQHPVEKLSAIVVKGMVVQDGGEDQTDRYFRPQRQIPAAVPTGCHSASIVTCCCEASCTGVSFDELCGR